MYGINQTRKTKLINLEVHIIKWKLGGNKEGIVIIFIFAASLFYLFSRIWFGLNVYDEGISLYGAVRVMEGYIPYRDFYYLYPPGNLYLLALLFKGFGPSILVSRIFNTIILFFILICCYFITQKIVLDKISLLISFFLITLWLGMDGSFNVLALPILCILFSSIFIFKYFENRSRQNLIIAGILTGITVYFRWDFSLYLFLSISLTLLIFNYIYYSDLGYNRLLSLIKAEKKLIIFWVFSILTIVPLVILLSYYVPINELISQFIIYPIQIYPLYSPFPWSYQYYDLIPIFIYLCISLWIFYNLSKRNFGSKKDWKVIFLLFLGLSLTFYTKVRPDSGHFFPAMIIALILFAFFCSEIIKINYLIQPQIAIRHPISTILKFLILFLIIGSFILYSTPVLTNKINNVTPLNLERGNGFYVSQQEDFIDAVKYIQLTVPPNDKIFVGNTNTDKTDVNNLMFYFLAGRDSGVFYYDLEPGVITTLPVQLEMINELQKNNVNYIILWSGGENINAQSNGIMVLDNYIQSHYILSKTFGNYTIYTIKNFS